MRHFIIKVISYAEPAIEGVIHIWAKSKRKARRKLRKYGEYKVIAVDEAIN